MRVVTLIILSFLLSTCITFPKYSHKYKNIDDIIDVDAKQKTNSVKDDFIRFKHYFKYKAHMSASRNRCKEQVKSLETEYHKIVQIHDRIKKSFNLFINDNVYLFNFLCLFW